MPASHFTNRVLLLALAMVAGTAASEIIPADRRTDWTPGTVVGVPGGIPNRTVIYDNVQTSTYSKTATNGKYTAGDKTIISYINAENPNGAGFNPNDVGRLITGAGIPPGTVIADVAPYQNFQAVLSAAPTITTNFNATFVIHDRHKVWMDGVHDDSLGINQAITDCPAGQVVYLPAGTYRIHAGINSTYGKRYTLRGAGPGKTILKPTASCGRALQASASDASHPFVDVTAGATKGSSQITIADTAHWVSGMLMDIRAKVNPTYVHMNKGSAQESQLPGFTFRITSVPDSKHVNFTPPLPFDFTGFSPETTVYNNAAGGYSNLTVTGVGYEDFTIDMVDAVALSFPIYWQQAYGCWIKNIECKNAHFRGGLYWSTVIQSEIRQCYFHDQAGSGSGAEGVDLADRCCWNLIEDNIIYKGGSLVFADAGYNCSGNVVGYNYIAHSGTPDASIAGADIDLGHGPHNMFNLIEGNVLGGIWADGYYGSTSHNTIFRNWITATDPVATQNLIAINLKHHNDYYNIVGNVLGTAAFPTTNNGPLSPFGLAANGSGWYEAPIVSGYDNGYSRKADVIYALGFPHIGNTGFSSELAATQPPDYTKQTYAVAEGPYDHNVKATLLRHGNYDYFNRKTMWDDSITDQTLPNSLYLKHKPSWFPYRMDWPSIGPDRTPRGGTIPAEMRFKGIKISSPASGLTIAPTP